MEQELEQLQNVYNLITEFLVNYSFQLLGALAILLIGIYVANKVGRWVERLCTSHGVDVTLARFLASCSKIAIVIGVAIICLNKIGISVTPFVAAIGAVSLGAGLAVQGLLSNYGAGLNIILVRPFVVGDTITVRGVTGIVDEVRLAYTILTDEDEVRITIPNRHIIGEILHNSSGNKLAEIAVGIAYGSDIAKATAAIRQVLEEHGATAERQPQIGIDRFADSGIEIGVRAWLPTARYHQMRFAINNGIYSALGRAGIEIPFPQREVRMLGND